MFFVMKTAGRMSCDCRVVLNFVIVCVCVCVFVYRLESEEERDTRKAKFLRSQSCISKLRTQLHNMTKTVCVCVCVM